MKTEPVLGKPEIVASLIREGFPADEAGRAFELIMEAIGRGLRKGRTIYFRKICKIWVLLAPALYRPDRAHLFGGEGS
jgi:hypothetical protein